jgi:hypothetical protein
VLCLKEIAIIDKRSAGQGLWYLMKDEVGAAPETGLVGGPCGDLADKFGAPCYQARERLGEISGAEHNRAAICSEQQRGYAPMISRMSSGSRRVEIAVEPTRSQNITVNWRRTGSRAHRARRVPCDRQACSPPREGARPTSVRLVDGGLSHARGRVRVGLRFLGSDAVFSIVRLSLFISLSAVASRRSSECRSEPSC